jgi:hypothetical protein
MMSIQERGRGAVLPGVSITLSAVSVAVAVLIIRVGIFAPDRDTDPDRSMLASETHTS